jgi:signal transduction histidine kinase/CheY-like chemotaxis protein
MIFLSAKHFQQKGSIAISRVWQVTLATAIAIAVFAALGLLHLRQNAFEGQSRELDLLSLALADEVDRGLQGVEEGLQAIRQELIEGQPTASMQPSTRTFKTLADLMPLVRTLWLVDGNGQLMASSDTTPTPDATLFTSHLMPGQADIMVVSRSFVDSQANESLVAVAIPAGKIGSPSAGWIVAAIPAKKLLGAFSVASPSVDARMAVFRDDGVLLAGNIVRSSNAGEDQLAKRLARPHEIELRQFRDGSTRLVSLHGLERYHLKVILTRDLQVMLVGWRQAADLTAATLAAVLLILFLSVFLVQRAKRKHASAQKELQLQMTRASKLESLGSLAGGVAHDFNNILAAIVGYGEMAQDVAPPGSAQARHLGKVLQAALRGKTLVERILTFSRGGAHVAIVFELQPVVEEVLGMLAVTLRPNVVMSQELQATGARLRGDPTQAFEAIMNLCTNAMQAMPQGGMLVINLKRLLTTEQRVLSHSKLAPGRYLQLSVSDQGTGMTPAVMDHLFEPFFTTRAAGSGTGLGLAVVHGVMAEFGGAIYVQSRPGHGANFILYFPECTDELEPHTLLPQDVRGGTGQTLLVVDDEPALVAMTQEALTALGYTAIGFSDSSLALQALRAGPDRFSAVITDEMMPGLTGIQLTKALHQFAPGIPVLLVSGYGGALLAKRAAEAGVSQVLSKPLQRAELARTLSELLR